MIDMHTVNQKKQRMYIDSYNTEEKKMINVHAVNKNKNKKYIDYYRIKKWLMCTLETKKTKKVYRFLQ